MIKFIDLFAGIGGIRIPFDELGYKCVFSSEWDKAACDTYEANFGERPAGDITKIQAKDIPQHDLLLAGFPCQAFSIMGKMKGFEDTRGTMFFEVARILSYHHPRAILLENVKQLTTHDKGKTFKTILEVLSELGYYVKWKVLNALDFGVPQKRERVIIVGFRDIRQCNKFDFNFKKKPYDLSDILENDEDVDKSLFASERIVNKRNISTVGKNIFYPSIWHENKAGNISILDHACALRTGASYNYLLINGIRRPSSRELLRLQGFPDSFKVVVSHSEIRRQTGNSVAVPMIREIAKKINNIINTENETPKITRQQQTTYSRIVPLNEFSDEMIVNIGRHFTYLLCTGRKDITGTDWGEAFAEAINGKHLDSPVGIADVVKERMAWSMKTVKNNNPFTAKSVRLISGRCSPDYSYGITDPHKDIQETGRAVLGIWNERINIAQDSYNPVRTTILIRSYDLLSYCLFEEENHRFRTSDYVWNVNSNGNLIGKNIETGETFFTWQPHGAQFTIHTKVPKNALKFTIQQPPILQKEETLKSIGFDGTWVKITR